MRRSLTVAHVIPSFGMGGQQRRIAALVDGLGEEWRHRIIALDGDMAALGLVAHKARVDAAPLVIAKSRGIHPGNLRRLRQLIHGADLLCTYNWGSLEAVVANLAPPRIPHVHYEDGFGPDEADGAQIARRVIARRLLLSRTIVATPSRKLSALAVDRWRLPARNVRLLPLGVDIRAFAFERDYNRAPPVVGSIGSLRAEKNYARLIRASALADISCLEIVGDGPERAALAQMAGENVQLPGATDRTHSALQRFDIFALSSDTEQAPISLMEAMASGLPVVAPDIGDIMTMVSEENRSAIVPPADETALAAALRRLAADGALRRTMGEANLREAQARFGADVMISANKKVFLEAMDAAS